MRKPFLLLMLLMILSALAHGQASRWDWSVQTINSLTPQPGGLYPVLTAPGSAVAICTAPANGTPCTNYATTYVDSTGTTTCPSAAQLTRANSAICVVVADQTGGFGAWLKAGNYQYTIATKYGNYGPFDLSVASSSGASGTVSGQTAACTALATGATALTKASPLCVDDVNTPTKITSTVPITAPSATLTGLGSGTSPVCPNGTSGALTTVGCTAGSGTVNSGQLALAQYPTSAGASVSPGNFTYDAATGNNLTIGTSGAGKSYLGSSIASAPPILDIRHPSFAGGAICDNGTNSIDAAFQAALNATPLKGGEILIPGSPLACYLANPTLISWPAFTGVVTLRVQGSLRLGNTFNSPVGKFINILGKSGSTLGSFQGAGESASISLNPLSGTCTGSIGSTITPSPVNTGSSIITATWSTSGTTLTLSQTVPDNSLVGTMVMANNIPAGTLVTANTGSSVTIGTPATLAGSGKSVVFASPFTPSTTTCLAVGNSGSANTVLGNNVGNTITSFPGSLITVGGSTACTITSISRASNLVNATLSGSCHIPIGSPVTVAGVTDSTFNGAFNPAGGTPKALEVIKQDYVLNTLTWRQTAADATSSGGTVTGFNEDTVETTFVTAINGSTVYAPFFRAHSSTDVWGVGAIANWGGQSLYKDFSLTDAAGTALFVSGGSFRSKFENVGISVSSFSAFLNYANWPIEVNSASFLDLINVSALAATQQPWGIRMTMPYNLVGSGSGPVILTKAWIGEGIKLDHGASGITIMDSVTQSASRATVTIDPTNYNNGNQQYVTILRTGNNDSPDAMTPCSVYFTTPASGTALAQASSVIEQSIAGTPNCITSDYFTGFVNTKNPAGNAVYNSGGTPRGVIGTYSDGRTLDAEVRGEQANLAPAPIPYGSLGVTTSPASWPTSNCAVTTGVLAPDGMLTAGSLTKASGAGSAQVYTSTISPAVGDMMLFGGWVYSPTAGMVANAGGQAFFLDNAGSTNYQFTTGNQASDINYTSNIADDWWHPTVAFAQIASSNGVATTFRMLLSCQSGLTMNFWQPFLIYIKASDNIPLREVMRWRQQLLHGYVPANGSTNTLYAHYPLDIENNPIVEELPNNTASGATLNKLVCAGSGSPAKAQTCTTASTMWSGVAVNGATGATVGNTQLARSGQASCIFDGTTVFGDYVQISGTVAGDCHDTGAATYPTSGAVIGRVWTVNSGAGTAATVNLYSPGIAAAPCPTAAVGTPGCVTPDGTTITATAGVLTAVASPSLTNGFSSLCMPASVATLSLLCMGDQLAVLTGTTASFGSANNTIIPVTSRATSDATAAHSAGWLGTRTLREDQIPIVKTGIAYSATTDYSANSRIQVGMMEQTCTQATLIASDTPACTYAMIWRSTVRGETDYQCQVDNGSGTPTVTPITGSAPANINLVSMSVSLLGGATPTSVVCKVGAASATVTTTLPVAGKAFDWFIGNTFPGGGATHIWTMGWQTTAQNGTW